MHENSEFNSKQKEILDQLSKLGPLERSVLGVDEYEQAVRTGVCQDEEYSMLKQRISIDELRSSHVLGAYFDGGFIEFNYFKESLPPDTKIIKSPSKYWRCHFILNRPTPLFLFENYIQLDYYPGQTTAEKMESIEKIVVDLTKGISRGKVEDFEKHPHHGEEEARLIQLDKSLTQTEFIALAEKFMEKFSYVTVSASYEKVPGYLVSEFAVDAQPNPFGYL